MVLTFTFYIFNRSPHIMTPYRDVDLSLPEVASAPRPWRFIDNAASYQYDWDGTSWVLAEDADAVSRLPPGDYCLPTGAFPWVPCRHGLFLLQCRFTIVG